MSINCARIRCLKEGVPQDGPVVYWMSRDQRIHDNWALLYAQEIALKRKAPLLIVFCLVPEFLHSTLRQYELMLGGLEEVISNAHRYNIPFYLCNGKPEEEIPRFITQHNCGVLITDFDPLRIKRRWKEAVAKSITIPWAPALV